MDSAVFGIPIGSLVTAGAAVAAVLIAQIFTARRGSDERYWELRRQAYGTILSELRAVERVCDTADDYIAQLEFHAYWESDARKRHEEEIGNRMQAARQRFSDDYLILSDSFISTFDEFEKAIAEDPHAPPDDDHDSFSAAIRSFRPQLIAIARSEMKANNTWISRLRS